MTATRTSLTLPVLALALACAVPAPGPAQEIGTSILPPATDPGDRAAGSEKSPSREGLEPDDANAQHETDHTIETETGPAPKTTSASGETGPLPDPLSDLRSAWRMAVEAGETELGFTAWTAALLAEETGRDQGTAAPAPVVEPGAEQANRTRMVSERWLARAGPVALGQAGRVVTTFGAAIPTAFCAPLMVCYIELEPGEVLTGTPSWGDTTRWQLRAKVQGLDPETIVMEIKPSEDAELTNLVIPTDRRLYTINLVNDPDIHTPILSFHYPDSAARAIADRIEADRAQDAAAQAAADAARAREVARTGVQTSTGTRPASELDFGFRVTGSARFRPVRVYTDGHRTFIDLHPDYRGELPTVLPGPGEDNKALNTRVTGNGTRLEADRVISDVYLQAGRQRVRIRRTGS